MGLDYNEKVFSVHRFGMLVVGPGSLWSNFGTNGFGHFLYICEISSSSSRNKLTWRV